MKNKKFEELPVHFWDDDQDENEYFLIDPDGGYSHVIGHKFSEILPNDKRWIFIDNERKKIEKKIEESEKKKYS